MAAAIPAAPLAARVTRAALLAPASTATTGGAKSSYWASLSTLETSVKAIPGVDVVKNGTNALKFGGLAGANERQGRHQRREERDFAAQTSALKSAVDVLAKSIQQMASPPTAAQLKALSAQVSAVTKATADLKNSAPPRCG